MRALFVLSSTDVSFLSVTTCCQFSHVAGWLHVTLTYAEYNVRQDYRRRPTNQSISQSIYRIVHIMLVCSSIARVKITIYSTAHER